MLSKTNNNLSESCLIKSLNTSVNSSITIPSSKSITHRALIVASLCDGISRIYSPLICDDTMSTIKGLKKFGVIIKILENVILIEGVNGLPHPQEEKIGLGDSGTSLRFLISYSSLNNIPCILTGSSQLKNRPIGPLIESLKDLGVETQYLGKSGYSPIKVITQLKGGKTSIRGEMSSQYLSSLLISSPYALNDTTIHLNGELVSKPYIDLTIKVMESFGVSVSRFDQHFHISGNNSYQSADIKVNGDFSNASYFFAIAAIMGGRIRVNNLTPPYIQGDKYFLDCLQMMGCEVTYDQDSISVYKDPQKSLNSIKVDLSWYPDIVPTLVIVSCFANSPTTINNIKHLRYKESDRINSLRIELAKIGGKIDATTDSITIQPIKHPRSAEIETYDDHRIAMSFSILGLKIPGIVIKNWCCVTKSFPTFFDLLSRIRG